MEVPVGKALPAWGKSPLHSSIVLLVTIISAFPLAGADGYYSEFQDWLVRNGYEHITPPQQRVALVDASHKDTWQGLELDPDDFAHLKAGPGRGVFATVDFAPQDILFTVHFNASLMLDPDNGPPAYRNAPEEASLACLLLREKAKGNESHFAPYLNILPKHVPMPWIDFDPEDFKAQLQFDPAVELAQTYKDEVLHWHSHIVPSHCAQATLAQLEWAVAMINTRIYYVPVHSGEGRMNATQLSEDQGEEPPYKYIFSPFSDMVNMKPGTTHIDWSQRVYSDRIEFVAIADIRRGQEIVDDYPSRSAVDYVVQMGFLPLDEPFDSAPLFPSIEDAVGWYVDTFDLCHMDESEANQCFDRLVVAARLAAATSFGDDRWEDEENDPSPDPAMNIGESTGRGLAKIFEALHAAAPQGAADLTQPDGNSAREHGLLAVKRRCEDLLSEFPTTIEEDETILEEIEIPSAESEDCSGGKATCPWRGEGNVDALKLVVRFRLNLKRRLKALIREIASNLDGSAEED